MKKIRLLLSLALLFCGASSQAQLIEVKENVGGVARKSHKDVKKVAIGYFGVLQTVQNSASQTAAGGSAYAKMTVNFGGVDYKAYQQVLKEVYDQAVNKLQSLGYEVLTPEQIKATSVETALPPEQPKTEKILSGTAQAIRLQAPVYQVDMDMTPLGYLPFVKRAKQLDAIMLNFDLSATAVGFETGGRFTSKAKVNAGPWLTLSGYVTSYPPTRTSTPAPVAVSTKTGQTDFVGPRGLYETSKNDMPWLGSSRGKYVLDIDQEKYLAVIKKMLAEAVDKSITEWHAALTK